MTHGTGRHFGPMPMTSVDYLLVGGGLASAMAADTLRQDDIAGRIALISAEDHLPYHRPALSKGFLLDDQALPQFLVHPPEFYTERNISVHLGTRALRVSPAAHTVTTDRAGTIRYRKLLIATGTRARRLALPGGDLGGVFYLRTIDDATALRDAMTTARKAVVVGASFIGMELAAAFATRGLPTTLIARESLLYDPLQSPEISAFFLDYYQTRGVEIALGQTATSLEGDDTVTAVVTDSGNVVPCDLVAIGVGVEPAVDFLVDSGLTLNDGLCVNAFMQTSDADILAAGDIAKFYDPVYRRHRRIEHWDNAVKQGRIAARNMLGCREAHRDVSYFYSGVFGIGFNFIGDPQTHTERVVRMTPPREAFSVLYLEDDTVQAGFLLKQPPAEEQAVAALIQNRIPLSRTAADLADPALPLNTWAVQTVLILQGGGALGAFECGVVQALEEHRVHPDVVAGVSIGAFNAAIVASHPGAAAPVLRAFWEELSIPLPGFGDETTRRTLSAWYSLAFGNPKFFRPRWLTPFAPPVLPMQWTSLYDPSPIKTLLRKYVDFEGLKHSPVRLLVNAVNVETAELETFDSYVDDMTPDHLLASGSLPPGFPWTTIDGRHYWDGGIISNSPLEQVVARCGLSNKKVYVVNLYPRRKRLPADLGEVSARRDEIVYSERVRRDIRTRELIDNCRQLVGDLIHRLDPDAAAQMMQHPLYIETMGQIRPISITRIVHQGEPGEGPSKDYEFSTETVREHIAAGYAVALRTLAKTSMKA